MYWVVVTHRKQRHWLLKSQERLTSCTTGTPRSWLTAPPQHKHTQKQPHNCCVDWKLTKGNTLTEHNRMDMLKIKPDNCSFKSPLTQIITLVHFLSSYTSFLECLHFHKFYIEYVCIIDMFNFPHFHSMKALQSTRKLRFRTLHFNYKTRTDHNAYWMSRNSEVKGSAIHLFPNTSAGCVKLQLNQ
jgi:hypothetical protein